MKKYSCFFNCLKNIKATSPSLSVLGTTCGISGLPCSPGISLCLILLQAQNSGENELLSHDQAVWLVKTWLSSRQSCRGVIYPSCPEIKGVTWGWPLPFGVRGRLTSTGPCHTQGGSLAAAPTAAKSACSKDFFLQDDWERKTLLAFPKEWRKEAAGVSLQAERADLPIDGSVPAWQAGAFSLCLLSQLLPLN